MENVTKELVREYFDVDKNDITILDGRVDVDGSANCLHNFETQLPFQFGEVKGYLSLEGRRLTTLKGCPKSVGDFNCDINLLHSLEGGPEICYIDYQCNNNPLTSLMGFPKTLVGKFYFDCTSNLPLLRLTGFKTVFCFGQQSDIVDQDQQRFLIELFNKFVGREDKRKAIIQCQKELL